MSLKRQDLWENGAPALFVNHAPGGVAHYRTMIPARELGASMLIRHNKDQSIIKQLGILEEPVVIYSMPRDDWMLAECEQILKGGQALIVDVDDDLRACIGNTDLVQPERFTEAYAEGWEDMLGKAHLVTCSTQGLADALLRRGVITSERRIHVVPNALDMDRFNIRKLPRHDEAIIIGWSGANGHRDAMASIAPAITEVLKANENVCFANIGVNHIDLIPEELWGRCSFTPFLPIYKHAGVLSQFHVTIAPSLNNAFYRAKSPIRALEAMASFSAVVGSPTTYGDVIEHDVNGMLATSHDEWVDALTTLVNDRKRRYRLTKAAHRACREQYAIGPQRGKWADAINAVI